MSQFNSTTESSKLFSPDATTDEKLSNTTALPDALKTYPGLSPEQTEQKEESMKATRGLHIPIPGLPTRLKPTQDLLETIVALVFILGLIGGGIVYCSEAWQYQQIRTTFLQERLLQNPNDPWNWFWYATKMRDLNRKTEAIKAAKRFLDNPRIHAGSVACGYGEALLGELGYPYHKTNDTHSPL